MSSDRENKQRPLTPRRNPQQNFIMCPIITTIGPFTIYSYGVMLAIAALLCSFLAGRDARRLGIVRSPGVIYDLVFWVVLGGIIGARVFFIFLNSKYFLEYPLEIIMIQKGGLAWQGSLLAGIATGLIFIRKQKLSLLRMLDLTAPYIALGQSIGRIGCFLNGCCYGKHLDHGIYFPAHHDHLHPTQLYSTAGLFLIFLLLKFYQKKTFGAGRVFVLYLLTSALLRFGIEFFRADHTEFLGPLSVFQIVSLGIFIAGVYVHTYLKSRRTGSK